MFRQMLLILGGCLLFTSCYRMPTDEDYCVIPATNHPDITHDQGSSAAPNFKY